MRASANERGRFQVGDWVSFRYGAQDLTAQVIEARGPIGVNRRHLYRVRPARDLDELGSFELPEDELRPAAAAEKEKVKLYLIGGGLIEILRSNLGGRDQPKAWLTYTPRGELTHTFIPDRGVVGGAPVPFWALQEDKVFTPRAEGVIAWLSSFGLNRADAEEVVRAVGTAP